MKQHIIILLILLNLTTSAKKKEEKKSDFPRLISNCAKQNVGQKFITGIDNFDDSGFVRHCHTTSKIYIPNLKTEGLFFAGTKITGDIQPGDVVFFGPIDNKISHCGIITNDKTFAHILNGIIRLDSLDSAPWNKLFEGAKRFWK